MEARYGRRTGVRRGAAELAASEKLDPRRWRRRPDCRPNRLSYRQERIGMPGMAALARAALAAVEFMQKSGLLCRGVRAGPRPAYFLPDGRIRFDARIYMREINPRHAVPEGDMLKRNPVLKAFEDPCSTRPPLGSSWPTCFAPPSTPTGRCRCFDGALGKWGAYDRR